MDPDASEAPPPGAEAGRQEGGSSFSHLFFFGANKAGMNDTKKEERDNIVFEMSKNSQYFQHASKLAGKSRARTEGLAARLACMTAQEAAAGRRRCEAAVLELEGRRDLSRICCVIGNACTFLYSYRIVSYHVAFDGYLQPDCSTTIITDMDMFFAAVEIRDAPHLKDLPVSLHKHL
jgi:DNA polymerase kappa